jgi:hypothetical protein
LDSQIKNNGKTQVGVKIICHELLSLVMTGLSTPADSPGGVSFLIVENRSWTGQID